MGLRIIRQSAFVALTLVIPIFPAISMEMEGMSKTVDQAASELRSIITNENCRRSTNNGFPIKSWCISSATMTSFVVGGGKNIDISQLSFSWKGPSLPERTLTEISLFVGHMLPNSAEVTTWYAVEAVSACENGTQAAATFGKYKIDAQRDNDRSGLRSCRITIKP